MVKRRYLSFISAILLAASAGTAYAQPPAQEHLGVDSIQHKERLIAGASIHTGMLLNHHSYMSILNEKRPWIAELYVAQKAYGQKPWQSFFGNPDIGAKFTLLDVGSPTYIGKSYVLHPFIRFYLLKEALFRPSITASVGAAYVEKTFDRKANYKNTAIGSHFNAFLQLQADVNIRLSATTHLFAGLSLSHLSNGSSKKPNAGINIVTVRMGAGYSFGEVAVPMPPDTKASYLAAAASDPTNSPKWSYRAILSGGIKEIAPIGGSKYGVGSLSFEASLKHLAYTRLSGSFDVFYDSSDYDAIKSDLSYNGADFSRFQTVKLGLAAGYELLFGKVSASIQAGTYLYAKQKKGGSFYQRYTIRYMAANRIGVQLGLKSHLGSADYIELGCIYKVK